MFHLIKGCDRLKKIVLAMALMLFSVSVSAEFAPVDKAEAVYLNKKVCLVGGEHETASNEIWCKDSEDNWEFVGNAPFTARHSFSSLEYQSYYGVNYAVFAGGIDAEGNILQDAWMTQNFVSWRQLADLPSPRAGLELFTVNGNIYFTSGYNDTGIKNDVYMYNFFPTPSWLPVVTGAFPERKDFQIFNIGGDLGMVYMFGGENGTGYLNDFWASDDGFQWRNLGTVPFSARKGFTGVTHQDKIYIFGGEDSSGLLNDVWVYDNYWTELKDSTVKPIKPRHWASMASDGTEMFLIGGSDYSQKFNDVFKSRNGTNWREI